MPSEAFRRAWEQIEQLRSEKGYSHKTIAEKCGFQRSTWFVYKKRGTIPFNLFERIAEFVQGTVQVSVITGTSDSSAITSANSAEEDPLIDYGRRFAKLLEEVPEDRQEAAFGAAFTAARAAIRDLPFAEPSAHQKGQRGRRR